MLRLQLRNCLFVVDKSDAYINFAPVLRACILAFDASVGPLLVMASDVSCSMHIPLLLLLLLCYLVPDSANSSVLINILTRTGSRPTYYQKLSESIAAQTYKNIRHIKSNDEPGSTCGYLCDSKDVISVKRGKGLGTYNTYLNTLGAVVTDGWVIILDDDSVLVNETFIESLAVECSLASTTDVLIYQTYIFPHKRVMPKSHVFRRHIIKKWDIDMSCFCIHHTVFRNFQFMQEKMGDFHFLDRIRSSVNHKYQFKFVHLPLGVWANYNGEKKGLSPHMHNPQQEPQTEVILPVSNKSSVIFSSRSTPSLVTSAIIIEPRNHIALHWVIENVHTALGSNVPIHLFHGLDNINLSEAIAIRYHPNIHLHNLQVHSMTPGNYSTYMTAPSMDKDLPEGHTLVFQSDSGFCNPHAEDTIDRLNTMTVYDYIGAPWYFPYSDINIKFCRYQFSSLFLIL